MALASAFLKEDERKRSTKSHSATRFPQPLPYSSSAILNVSPAIFSVVWKEKRTLENKKKAMAGGDIPRLTYFGNWSTTVSMFRSW